MVLESRIMNGAVLSQTLLHHGRRAQMFGGIASYSFHAVFCKKKIIVKTGKH
jgi:hypothetical protein